MNNTKQMDKFKAIETSRGQFFGIQTKNGQKRNVRFLGMTDNYVRFYDRNSQENVKLAKSSIVAVNIRGGCYVD